MGWEGKVTLKVKVLASGLRGWRFVAARHAGQPITRNFLVPIPFVLE